MKRNIPILILALILGATAAYFILTQKKDTVKEALKDFAVSDTASITKIFIADKQGHQALLQRQAGGKWKINNKYYAQQAVVNTLLETMKELRMRTRVGKIEFNSVINTLASSAVKCEIYTNNPDKPFKVYYVGSETQDLLGTYMLLENSSTPFVMEIPGFNGYLNSRYFTNEQDWREHTIFNYKPEDISSITVTYTLEPDKSFKIERQGTSYKVSSPVTGQVIANPDSIALESYLGFFGFINHENFDLEFSQKQRDSLISLGPLSTITVKDKSGKENSIKIYPKPITQHSLTRTDPEGKPLQYDLDRMYALINNGQDFVVIQQYVFEKLFRKLSDFDASVKKTKPQSH